MLTRNNSDQPFPTLNEISGAADFRYCFSVDGNKYFLADIAPEIIPAGFSFRNIRELRRSSDFSRLNTMIMFTAYHLHCWYSNSRFCGKCGSKNVPYTKERALICSHCGKITYPRLNPAVIVGVVSGDRLLITRYAENRGVRSAALVAGYTEIGETLEETVQREVMEEVGLKVKNIRYYASQPWGFSQGILAGFFCETDGCDTVKLDETELSSAVWTERENITGQPDDYSLTHNMMMYFKKYGLKT